MLFKYKIDYCSPDEDYKEQVLNGVTWAESFSAAMRNLEEYYGEDEIERVLLLEAIIDTNVVEMEKDWTFKEDYVW